MNLQDKVAYITGGTKGIGYGVAEVLLNAGMRVAISGRNMKTAKEAASKLSTTQDRVLALESDVSNLEDEKKATKEILNKWGQLDVVIANAGVGHYAPVDELDISDWNEMMNTNLTGVFYTLRGAVSALKESHGYFITIASLAGTNFFPNGAGYN